MSNIDPHTDLTTVPREEALAAIDQTVREAVDAARAATIQISADDRELGLSVLAEQLGSRAAAAEKIALKGPSVLAEVGPQIAALKAERAEQEKAREAADYAESPAGLREAAAAASKAKVARATLADDARALLSADEYKRYSDELLGRMTDEELIAEAGLDDIEPEPEPLVTPPTEAEAAVFELRRTWFQLSRHQQEERCNELGISFPDASREMSKKTSPNIFA